MNNPNNPAAKVYDLIYDDYINAEQTSLEIEFIASLLWNKKTILDVACGTGRHLVPLAEFGYEMTGVDYSEKMLSVARSKLKKRGLKAELSNHNIHEVNKFAHKFDGAICFWNAFTEMAKNKKEAEHVFNLIFKSLKKDGLFIMELTNPDVFDFGSALFKSKQKKGGKTYDTTFETVDFDKEKNTTRSEEKIIVKKDGKKVEVLKSYFDQQWWTKKQITNLSKKVGFRKAEFYNEFFKPFTKESDTMILVATK